MTSGIRILARRVLSRGNGLLEKFTVSRKRFAGPEQTFDREIYDTGNGVAILLYDPSRSRVILVRQFRMTAYLREGRESLIEVCAGRLEGADAETRIIKEAEEETGIVVRNPCRLFEAYMSPGTFSEKLTFFTAQYTQEDRTGKGGGLHEEDEDIEILEPTLDEALAMIGSGEIVDAKTILLLHYADRAGLMLAPR
ncbi:NUDIX domain-containing protein [Methylocapsa sp. D3K7]|uniref:NUDIX domain-containing protein n=1 Tax=Methylocapsa sp. D3K7 TaxID=3041435 RepID=UPI00244E89AF|nr:NUDIX domain-containing protein [Methylocapsa sp. D3K7]WGJ14631.1 NUDIX domain-containing protein [Methylocapsa sp. D3K7]